MTNGLYYATHPFQSPKNSYQSLFRDNILRAHLDDINWEKELRKLNEKGNFHISWGPQAFFLYLTLSEPYKLYFYHLLYFPFLPFTLNSISITHSPSNQTYPRDTCMNTFIYFPNTSHLFPLLGLQIWKGKKGEKTGNRNKLGDYLFLL